MKESSPNFRDTRHLKVRYSFTDLSMQLIMTVSIFSAYLNEAVSSTKMVVIGEPDH